MIAMSISEGRKKLFELRQSIVDDSETAILTHRDGNMVLISQDTWDRWNETLRLHQDKVTMKAIDDHFDDRDSGIDRGVPLNEAFPDMIDE